MLGDKTHYKPEIFEQRLETLIHEFLHGVGYRHFTNFS